MTYAQSAFCAVLAFFLFVLPAKAQQLAPYVPVQTSVSDLMEIDRATVAEIVRPDMLRTTSGKIYILDNIRIPRLYDERALTYLTENILNKEVIFYANPNIGDGAVDRFGNFKAHVSSADGAIWVQGEMVKQGLAWADSSVTNRDLIKPLLTLEETARKDAKGFWSAPGLRVRTPKELVKDINSFQIFEGKIVEATEKQGVFFLNFDTDWKTDTTLRASYETEKFFRTNGIYMRNYKNQTVRARGWVRQENGPMIDLTHPEQIEILPPPPEKAPVQDKAPAVPVKTEAPTP